MMYLGTRGNRRGGTVPDAMRAGHIGQLCQPGGDRSPEPEAVWAADNGCFNERTYVGDDAWFAWLQSHTDHVDRCLFATAPDVIGDAAATLTRSAPWLPRIRALGYKAALVAQDGLEHLDVPWDTFDVLFIGGSTGWKMSPAAFALATQARDHGKGVHVGRVNSQRRYAAWMHHADSCDGTFLAFGPDALLPHVLAWTRLSRQETLL